MAIVLVGCADEPTPVAANKQATIQQAESDTTLSDSARVQLVERLVMEGAYRRAVTETEFLLRKDSSNPGWLYMKADALERLGDTAAAISTYEQAIASAGLFAEAELRTAILLAETGNSRALTYCDALLQTAAAAGMRSDVLRTKGIYFARVRNYSKALETFSQLIREDYSYMDAYVEKGLVYYDQGNYAEAWKVFNKSTEVSQKFADGYFWMARAEEKMNRKADAINNYRRALVFDPSLAEAKEALQQLEQP